MRMSSPRSYMSRTFPEERSGRSAIAVTRSRLAIVEVTKQRADALHRFLRAPDLDPGVREALEGEQLVLRRGGRGCLGPQARRGVLQASCHRVGPLLHHRGECLQGRTVRRAPEGEGARRARQAFAG